MPIDTALDGGFFLICPGFYFTYLPRMQKKERKAEAFAPNGGAGEE
jgi:hypothetical protein